MSVYDRIKPSCELGFSEDDLEKLLTEEGFEEMSSWAVSGEFDVIWCDGDRRIMGGGVVKSSCARHHGRVLSERIVRSFMLDQCLDSLTLTDANYMTTIKEDVNV